MRSHTHFLRRHSSADVQKQQPSLVFPLTSLQIPPPLVPQELKGEADRNSSLPFRLCASLIPDTELDHCLALPSTLRALGPFFPCNYSTRAGGGTLIPSYPYLQGPSSSHSQLLLFVLWGKLLFDSQIMTN